VQNGIDKTLATNPDDWVNKITALLLDHSQCYAIADEPCPKGVSEGERSVAHANDAESIITGVKKNVTVLVAAVQETIDQTAKSKAAH
jgi:hypothetical protein